MANQDELMQKIQTAEATLSAVLNDVSVALPANSPASIALRMASVSIPAMIEMVRGAVQAATAHHDQAGTAPASGGTQQPPPAAA